MFTCATQQPRSPRYAFIPRPGRYITRALLLGKPRRRKYTTIHPFSEPPLKLHHSITSLPPSFIQPDFPTTTSHVWGVAYHIPHAFIAPVVTYLDLREINGYTIDYIDFYPSPPPSPSPFSSTSLIPHALLYIGLPSNPQYVGPETPDAVADVIRESVGPSGTNADYLFRLEESLVGLGPEAADKHVSGLVERVRGFEEKEV